MPSDKTSIPLPLTFLAWVMVIPFMCRIAFFSMMMVLLLLVVATSLVSSFLLFVRVMFLFGGMVSGSVRVMSLFRAMIVAVLGGVVLLFMVSLRVFSDVTYAPFSKESGVVSFSLFSLLLFVVIV